MSEIFANFDNPRRDKIVGSPVQNADRATHHGQVA